MGATVGIIIKKALKPIDRVTTVQRYDCITMAQRYDRVPPAQRYDRATSRGQLRPSTICVTCYSRAHLRPPGGRNQGCTLKPGLSQNEHKGGHFHACLAITAMGLDAAVADVIVNALVCPNGPKELQRQRWLLHRDDINVVVDADTTAQWQNMGTVRSRASPPSHPGVPAWSLGGTGLGPSI